jgi:hypothetical protein
METKLSQWVLRGYADSKELTPAKRAPNYPDHILYLSESFEVPQTVIAYWEGWNAGNMDSVRRIMSKQNIAAT